MKPINHTPTIADYEAQIRAEAIKATLAHSDVNQACPYPFGTGEAFVFCAAFNTEKNRQMDEILRDTKTQADLRTIEFNTQLQHPNSIASDAINDEAEDALQTGYACAIRAGLDNIQPIDAV